MTLGTYAHGSIPTPQIPEGDGNTDPDERGRWRRERLSHSRLYLCTDARRKQGDFAEFIEACLRGGVDIIQLRDKSIEAGEELEYHQILADATRRYGALHAANDRVDIALAAGADIIHVGQKDIPVPMVRTLVGPSVLIGHSTHSAAQAQQARHKDTDYYCIGPVWETPTKPGRPAVGLSAVQQVAQDSVSDINPAELVKPWFAIGGINTETVGQVLSHGAQRIVVVRALTQAEDPEVTARELVAALDKNRDSLPK